MSQLIAGAGTADVQLGADCFPTAEPFSGKHDNHVRALYLECGEALLIVTIEITSIMSEAMASFLGAAKAASGLDEEHIWICATHTFGGPHIWDNDAPRLQTDDHRAKNAAMRRSFTAGVTEAVTQAMASRQAARLGYGSADCTINVSRDVETAEGWWLGHNEDELSDRTVAVLKFTDLADHPIALFFNYGMQSSVTKFAFDENGMCQMTGDVAGAACLYLEEEFGVPAVFCVGACGDQAPVFEAKSTVVGKDGVQRTVTLPQSTAFLLMEQLGRRLGEAATRAANRAVCAVPEGELKLEAVTANCPAQTIRPIQELHPTHDYDYREGGTVPLTVVGAGIGDVVLVGALPEMTSRIALRLKEASPAKHTILLNMVSNIKNTEKKYLADSAAYDCFKYEAMNSFYARGSADLFLGSALALIERLQE